MKEIKVNVSFATPAFLGNAEQVSQWRTPPFKALLRQWWRVVKARECGYDHSRLLQKENRLFGQAPAENDSHEVTGSRSALRIRLGNWRRGTLSQWEGDKRITHPEVKNPQGIARPIGAQLFLGYGPLTFGAGQTIMKKAPAIQTQNEMTELWLGFPDEFYDELKRTIDLIGWFGTLGGRSRNGWGSLILNDASPLTLSPLSSSSLEPFTRPWQECLGKEWAHAIGKDRVGPLVWQTKPMASWKDVVTKLAEVKIGFRTHFRFSSGGPHQQPQPRHVIAYPITKHFLGAWGGQKRLSNQIRFKVAPQNGKFVGLVFHLPTKAPEELVDALDRNNTAFREMEPAVWREIHGILDGNPDLSRLK